MSTSSEINMTKYENKEEYWQPMESDPTLMSDYLRSLTNGTNCNGRYLIDIPSIDLVDEMNIFDYHNVIGYIFLYPMKSYKCLGKLDDEHHYDKNLFFFKQFVHNSCASVALFHAYINTIDPGKLSNQNDSLIDKFYHENLAKSPEERGIAFAENQQLKQLHHDYAKRGQSNLPQDEQLYNIDYHYVAFIPNNGSIFELDGRQSLPIVHQININDDDGKQSSLIINEDNFKHQALNIMKKYMQLDPDNLHYSVLALCASIES